MRCLPAAPLPHVFDRFWRAQPSRAREQGGSGLGLAIVKQLVEAQGGQAGVESEPGRGSVFWVKMQRSRHGASLTGEGNGYII